MPDSGSLIKSHIWRLNNLYHIRTKAPGYQGKVVLFQPNRVQREIYKKMEEHNRVIILKPRKLGVSTGIILYLLDKAMYCENQMCRTIAHRKQTVSEMFNDIARFAFDRIDERLRSKEKYTTRAELQFTNLGSKYSIDVEARGLTPTYLHFSEIAYVEEEAKLQDTLESLSMEAHGIAESTANGKGNWFEQTFNRNYDLLKRGKDTSWYPLFFAWFDDPYNSIPFFPESEFHYPEEVAEVRAKFKNFDGTQLRDDQLLFWDRKKFELGDRLPELYPSTSDEAFIHSTGKVYREFSQNLNVIPPVDFKEFRVSMDWGQTNPMCFLFIHQDSDGNHIVFKEFYRRECPIKEACNWLRDKGVRKIDYADPSVFNRTMTMDFLHHPKQDHRKSVADLFRERGIRIRPGSQNDIMAGVSRVKEYLRFDSEHVHPFKRDAFGESVHGSPRLFITENCENTIWEFGQYRWPQDPRGGLNRSSYEKPMEKDNHAMDCVRYYILSHAKPLIEEEEEIRPRTPAYFMMQKKLRNRSVVY